MKDWKCQLGLIVPSRNITMEYECWRMAPDGISIHTSRLVHAGSSDEAALEMAGLAPGKAELLSHAKVKAICFGCTSSSFQISGIDQEIIKNIESVTKTPATTTATAVAQALSYLGLKSVAIASPYSEKTNALLVKYLINSGFKVSAQKGLGIEWSAALPPESAYELALDVNDDAADGILISCTNYRSLEVIEKLEAELGKPVVSSNTASLWKLLQLSGVKEKVKGAGQLFR